MTTFSPSYTLEKKVTFYNFLKIISENIKIEKLMTVTN